MQMKFSLVGLDAPDVRLSVQAQKKFNPSGTLKTLKKQKSKSKCNSSLSPSRNLKVSIAIPNVSECSVIKQEVHNGNKTHVGGQSESCHAASLKNKFAQKNTRKQTTTISTEHVP